MDPVVPYQAPSPGISENQVESAQPVEPRRGQSKLLLGVVIGILTAGVGFGGYFFLSRSRSSAVQTPSLVTAQPPLIVDPTANWKLYTNTTYGYSIKYPSTWNLQNSAGRNPDLTNQQLAQETYVSAFDPNVPHINPGDARREVSISVRTQDQNARPLVCADLNDCLNKINYIYAQDAKKQEIQVAGHTGIQITYAGPEWIQMTDAFVFMNGYLYQFGLITQKSDHPTMLPIFDQILSTFSLTEDKANPTVNWKTYKNIDYSYQISYPTGWSVTREEKANAHLVQLTQINPKTLSNFIITVPKPYIELIQELSVTTNQYQGKIDDFNINSEFETKRFIFYTGQGQSDYVVHVIINAQSSGIDIVASFINPPDQTELKQFYQILSTFTFFQ